MADRLSALQRDVLRALDNLTVDGQTPTVAELADAVGIGAHRAWCELLLLEDAGYLRWDESTEQVLDAGALRRHRRSTT